MSPAAPKCRCGECRACRHRGAQKRYAARTREQRRAAVRAWRQSPEGKAWERARRKRDRVKIAARRAVSNAIKSGRLVRGECEQKGPDCRGKIEGHHDDHTKPLEVRWLCKHHHHEADNGEEQAA